MAERSWRFKLGENGSQLVTDRPGWERRHLACKRALRREAVFRASRSLQTGCLRSQLMSQAEVRDQFVQVGTTNTKTLRRRDFVATFAFECSEDQPFLERDQSAFEAGFVTRTRDR